MAHRVRVVAIRETNPHEVRDALVHKLGDDWSRVNLCEENGWTSFRVSVWAGHGQELLELLEEWNKPALLITSEDGDRWYAILCRPDQPRVQLVHEFGYHSGPLNENYWSVDDEEDEETDEADRLLEENPTAKPTTAFERFAADLHESYGCPLPGDLIDQARHLPFQEAIEHFRRWHENSLIDFLRSSAVDCDFEAVGETLRWQGLTDMESESDLGNLPRLLAAIGLGGEWDAYLQEVAEMESQEEDSGEEFDDDDDREDGDFGDEEVDDEEASAFTILDEVIRNTETVAVEGGPVVLPMKRFRLVEFFVQAACEGFTVATTMSFEFPESQQDLATEIAQIVERDADIESAALPRGFKLGFEDHEYIDRSWVKDTFGKRLAKLIVDPPHGTRFEFAFAAANEPSTRQIYQGYVSSGEWLIDATYPPLTAAVLQEALDMASNAHKLSQPVRDEDEAKAVLAALEDSHHYLFQREEMAIVHAPNRSVSGGIQFIVGDEEQSVAVALFRLRYAHAWDVTPAEKSALEYRELLESMESEDSTTITAEQQRKLDEFNAQMKSARRAAVRDARDRVAKRIGDPFYEGKASRYWRSDMGAFGDQHEPTIRKFENGVKRIGYLDVGDMTCKRYRDFVLRCYVHPEGLNYATLTVSRDSVLCIDFTTLFSDGSRLTTTTSLMAESRPQIGLYYKSYPELGIADLHAKHEELVDRLRSRKRVDISRSEATIEGYARAFDEVLQRADQDDLADLEATRDIWRF